MYNVIASYNAAKTGSINPSLDTELDQLAGRTHRGESFDFDNQDRDLSWLFVSKKEAQEAQKRLQEHKSITSTFLGELKDGRAK